MSVLLVYASSHGCTKTSAEILKEKIGSEITMINLKKEQSPDLPDFDTVIIGGSIHAGQIQKAVKTFCSKNIETLKQKTIGLYLCCMYEGEKAKEQFRNAFPPELTEHAKAKGLFGGEFDFEKMNFAERLIVKKVSGIKESVSKINKKAITKFASEIKQR